MPGDQGTCDRTLAIRIRDHAMGFGIMVLTRDPPRRDDLDIGLQSVESELESNLIIAFSGAAMGHEAYRQFD